MQEALCSPAVVKLSINVSCEGKESVFNSEISNLGECAVMKLHFYWRQQQETTGQRTGEAGYTKLQYNPHGKLVC